MKYLKTSLVAAAASSLVLFASLARSSEKEVHATLKTVSCPPECGYSVTSRDEKEVIESVRVHAKIHHHLDLTDDQIRAMIKEKTAE